MENLRREGNICICNRCRTNNRF